MCRKGGRRDVFLGTRECQAYVEPCEYGTGEGYYDDYDEVHFGTMVHGLNYPDETGRNLLETRLWQPRMIKGYITFIRPEECSLIRPIKEMQAKSFKLGESLTAVDDEYAELEVNK